MRICFIPIDNRPVCYDLAKLIANSDNDIELFIPPKEFMGGLTTTTDTEQLYQWLQTIPNVDGIVISLDTIAYGGLVASRRSPDNFETIKSRLEKFKQLFREKSDKIFAFSSIMRISNNNYNIEEKEYWSKYGKKIFDYSFFTSKAGKWGMESCVANLIPDEILADYMSTRRRNFDINKLYLEWQKEGVFDFLIFSKDDCAEYGFNVDEAKELELLGGKTITGADEIPLTLLAKILNRKISVCPIFTEKKSKHLISKYEDISVENSVLKQIQLAGYDLKPLKDVDIALIINNFRNEQGEIVMKVDTEPFDSSLENIIPNNKPFIIADVRFANGADNAFVQQLFQHGAKNFLGYAGWNTTANTLGSLLCMVKYFYTAKSPDLRTYYKLLATRFIDDWGYQANIRQQIETPCDIKDKMTQFETCIAKFLGIKFDSIKYSFPWERLFEIDCDVRLEADCELNGNLLISHRAIN